MKVCAVLLAVLSLTSTCLGQETLDFNSLLEGLEYAPEELYDLIRSDGIEELVDLDEEDLVDFKDFGPLPAVGEVAGDSSWSVGSCAYNDIVAQRVHGKGGGGFYEGSSPQAESTVRVANSLKDHIDWPRKGMPNKRTALLIVDDAFGLSNPGRPVPESLSDRRNRYGPKLSNTQLVPPRKPFRTYRSSAFPVASPVLQGLSRNASVLGIKDSLKYLEDHTSSGRLTHGDLVLHHTLSVLYTLSRTYTVDMIAVNDPPAKLHDQGEPLLDLGPYFAPFNMYLIEFPQLGVTVATVDTGGYRTGLIASRIAAAIQTLDQSGIERFAVNMSFGLVPCSVIEKVEGRREKMGPNYTLLDYVGEVMQANGGKELPPEELRRILVSLLKPTDVESDPLRQLIQLSVAPIERELSVTGSKGEQVTYVASAGNYDLPFPLFPAAWPEVISVSAGITREHTDPFKFEGMDRTVYSNIGEEMLPGDFFLDLSRMSPAIQSKIAVAGTSFAAPVLAVFAALDMTYSSTICAYRPPALAHLDFFKLGLQGSSVFGENLDLTEALRSLCNYTP